MPALYRMPVFYLALLIGGAGYALVDHFRPEPVVEPLDSTAQPAAPPAPIVRDSTAVVEGGSASDGILRTRDGLRRKVVVKDLAVVAGAAPGSGSAVGAPLDYFAIRYLHGAEPADHPDWLQVGARGEPPQGWVPAASVLEWDTRLMARPTARRGRPRLVIYRDEACAGDAAPGGLAPATARTCPTQGEEPVAAADDTAAPPLGMPILATAEADGRTLFEVASLVKDAPPSRSARPSRRPTSGATSGWSTSPS